MKLNSIRWFSHTGILVLLLAVCLLLTPVTVKADGGPAVDPSLFAKLKEGQQIAVINLLDENTASIDLFVSILDQTGESHEVTYFVPLGVQATRFSVVEENAITFGNNNTNQLDSQINRDHEDDKESIRMFFAGALLTNGIWFIPFWAPLLFSACEAAPAPLYTYETESSKISIFDINDATDIEELVNITGLDPAVVETLSRLRGQQIAVTKIMTQPHGNTVDVSSGGSSSGEPGLHLSWKTTLTSDGNKKVYAYPLGTGTAWAHPIEMTRVYVVSRSDLNFTVQYPKLGTEASGFVWKQGRADQPQIAECIGIAAYAVEDVFTSEYKTPVHIWRATYTNSNAAEDIIIDVNGEQSIMNNIRTGLDNKAGMIPSLITGIVLALILWLLAWYFLARRMLGEEISKNFWSIPLIYMGWNLLLFIPGAILYVLFILGGREPALLLLLLIFGAISAIIYKFVYLPRTGVSFRKAIGTFVAVTFASNGAYLLFVIGYAWLLGAL